MALFDKITQVPLKDCFEDNNLLLTFVVDVRDVGKAIGKGALLVRKLEQLFKRKVRIIGFHREIQECMKQIIYPLRVSSIELQNNILFLKSDDRKTKSLLIGRNAQNLRNSEAILKRYFPDIVEVKVV